MCGLDGVSGLAVKFIEAARLIILCVLCVLCGTILWRHFVVPFCSAILWCHSSLEKALLALLALCGFSHSIPCREGRRSIHLVSPFPLS
jgi:hypothetical protein